MVWRYFFKEVLNSSVKIDLSGGILLHSGGWKKLIEQSVSNELLNMN